MSQSLDTNVALRLIVGDIPEQRDAALRLLEDSGGHFEVADVVFVELEYALRQHYGLARVEIEQLLRAFASHSKIRCNRVMLDVVWQSYASKPALSFTDIALAAYAQLNNATALWTFDKKLASQSDAAQLLAC